MQLDWFTVIAQIFNFLILVWLLKRFLYRPILNAIDARERRIALTLADADTTKVEAQQARDEFRHKNEVFEQQRTVHLSQMMAEVKAERQQFLDVARQESEALRVRQQQTLIREQQGLNEALNQGAQEEVFAIARKTLTDLAGATLEERMVDVFLSRLAELDETSMAELKSSFVASVNLLRVRTAFTLPMAYQTRIETAIKAILGKEKQVQFETTPNLVCGIELSSDGHKLAWSIDNYLASLGKRIDTLLKPEVEIMAKPKRT